MGKSPVEVVFSIGRLLFFYIGAFLCTLVGYLFFTSRFGFKKGKVSVRVKVKKSAQEVYEFLVDRNNMRAWVHGFIGSEWKKDAGEEGDKPGVGSIFIERVVDGKHVDILATEILHLEQDRRVHTMSEIPGQHREWMDVVIEPAGPNASTVHFHSVMRFQDWVSRLLVAVEEKLTQKKLKADSKRFKYFCEVPSRAADVQRRMDERLAAWSDEEDDGDLEEEEEEEDRKNR